MTWRASQWVLLGLLGVLTPGASALGQMVSDSTRATATAPDSFAVAFETSKGTFIVLAHRDWSPLGVDRFYDLVRLGYFSEIVFYRTVAGFVAQFGSLDPPTEPVAWDGNGIPDEPVRASNTKGRLHYARSGPNSRSTHFSIMLVDNRYLDTVDAGGVIGFPPIGEVIQGMEVVESLNTQYGQQTLQNWDSVEAGGRRYIERTFPGLDTIRSARIATVFPGQ